MATKQITFNPKTRNRIELAIEGLLKLLDNMESDVDLEDTGDDEYYLTGAWTDLEGDHCDDESSYGLVTV